MQETAVADPGAKLVRIAHSHGIRIVPIIGPSSILLALMASGLSGQQFAFHGYLPAKPEERSKRLKELEAESRRQGRTQIFIETPYRNRAMFDAIVANCHPETWLCVASDLTLPNEQVQTQKLSQWKKAPPDCERRPTVFLVQAD